MYYKIEDFTKDWANEDEMTLKIFNAITEETAFKKPHEEIRSLARMAWHITETLTEMPAKGGLLEEDVLEGKEISAEFKEIVDLYIKHSGILIEAIKEKWNDKALTEKVELYGESWEKGKLLTVLLNHQIHHRAQMTIAMRLVGLKVPGIYGPAKEEWANFGMPPME